MACKTLYLPLFEVKWLVLHGNPSLNNDFPAILVGSQIKSNFQQCHFHNYETHWITFDKDYFLSLQFLQINWKFLDWRKILTELILTQ